MRTCVLHTVGVFHQLLYFVLNHHADIGDPDEDLVKDACEVLINCTYKNPTVSRPFIELIEG